MNSKLTHPIMNVANRFRQRFRKSITTRGALGISILLHLFIAMAFASFLAGTYYIESIKEQEESIVFDLETETNIDFSSNSSNSNLSSQLDGKLAENSRLSGLESSSSSGKGSPSAVVNNESAVLASFASLTDLKESFSFVMQQVSADSLNGFSPVFGDAPDTKIFSAGFNDGNGYGNGRGSGISISIGGGGHCPAGGPGGIYQ